MGAMTLTFARLRDLLSFPSSPSTNEVAVDYARDNSGVGVVVGRNRTSRCLTDPLATPHERVSAHGRKSKPQNAPRSTRARYLTDVGGGHDIAKRSDDEKRSADIAQRSPAHHRS